MKWGKFPVIFCAGRDSLPAEVVEQPASVLKLVEMQQLRDAEVDIFDYEN